MLFYLFERYARYFLVAFNTKTVTRVNTPTHLQESLIESGSKDTTKVEFTINKNSSDKDLENITSTLKNVYSVSQSFAGIQRNKKGEIINISSSFTVAQENESTITGTNTFNDLNGIKPFMIYIETDRENKIISMGHESEEYNNMQGLKTYQQNKKAVHNPEATRIKASSSFNANRPIDPIYIVDGKEVWYTYDNINPNKLVTSEYNPLWISYNSDIYSDSDIIFYMKVKD